MITWTLMESVYLIYCLKGENIMSMLFSAENYVSEVNKFKDICAKQFDVVSIINMDELELKILQTCFDLLDSSNELIIEQARLIDEMDDKWNRLLHQVSKRD